MSQVTRRALLISAPLAAVAAPAAAQTRARGAFTHGVASGDPTVTSVILWTRFVPATPGAARITWEVAEDERFARVRARGEANASALKDHCVKVDARGLAPGRRYFYRFLSAGDASPTGLTRTAPAGGVASLSLAVLSCANKPFGYFHAYAHAAARNDIDLCIHTGDYIYEYPRGTYPGAGEAVAGRSIDPATETVALSDYHARYASYRSDPGLQELHRRTPFLVTWDDHELSNDAWKDGAENHQPATEGEWSVRRAVAAAAYDDWLPIRRQTSLLQIYRRLEWGSLATILMLDSRLIGRDRQLDWRPVLEPVLGRGDAAMAQAINTFGRTQLGDANRSLLGAPQEAWMRREMRRSKARGVTWQVLAQQLVMGKQGFPAAAASLLPDTVSERTKQFVATGALANSQGYGWNLDAWSGYPPARERFLQSCAEDGANALVLSGDSHNAWANNLPGGRDGRPAAIELAGASITSPGFERTFRNAAPGAREAAMVGANAELAWCDVTRRGYAVATLTREKVSVDWLAFESVTTPTAPTPTITKSSAEATRAHGVGKWQFG